MVRNHQKPSQLRALAEAGYRVTLIVPHTASETRLGVAIEYGVE